MKHICPGCFAEIPAEAVRCPVCGFDLAAYDGLDFEERLLLATRHPIREHQMMAVQVLGQRRSRLALARFADILANERDPYVCLVVLRALRNYPPDVALSLVRAAEGHRSRLVARFARELEAELRAGPPGPPGS
jgi:hypothetical protein